MELKSILKENETLLLNLCGEDEIINNILYFWKDKIKLYLLQFSNFENIYMIICENDEIIKKLNNKIENKENESEIIDKEYLKRYETENNSINTMSTFRDSMPLNIVRKKSKYVDSITSNSSIKDELYKSPSPLKKESISFEIEENEKNVKRENNIFFKSILSSKILPNEQFNMIRYEDEEDKIDEKHYMRFGNKKFPTVEVNSSNNLKIKLFNFQEELEDNNYITKMKKSKPFLNFIDIDLFFQYIALGKKFYECEEENTDLIEGFCLQYQTFIFPETLINKLISCFDYFYDLYLNKDKKIIEEKNEDEENKKNSYDDSDEDENINKPNIVLHRRNAFKIRKRLNSFDIKESSKKIPFGLIDFLYTFIKLHNTYFHNDLSNNVITKIYDFLKRLFEISVIKEKYEQKLDLSQIELKEYENSIKPMIQTKIKEKIKYSCSSDEFSSEDEKDKKDLENKEENKEINPNKDNNGRRGFSDKKLEKEEKNANINNNKKVKFQENKKNEDNDSSKKVVYINLNKTFKLTSLSKLKENKFLNIYIGHKSTKV